MLCYDCPRNCGVDREKTTGFCRESNKIRVAKVIENFMWEEPCLTGEKGGLAIFFSGCNLRCKFCQNFEISHIGKGQVYSTQEFKKLLLSYNLERFSCIDLITPSHFSSALAEVFENLKLPIPIVWNSNGYEKVETLKRVSKFVDVFLVDLKYVSNELSKNLSCIENYFQVAEKAVKFMSQEKPNIFDGESLKQGLIIRHLVLPNNVKDSLKVLDFVKENIDNPIISLMSQFTPTKQSPIKRKLIPLEFKAVVAYAEKCGLTQGYTQDLTSSSQDFIPKF